MFNLNSRILVTSVWHLGQLNSASLAMNRTSSATTPANTDENDNNKSVGAGLESNFEKHLAVSLAFRDTHSLASISLVSGK